LARCLLDKVRDRVWLRKHGEVTGRQHEVFSPSFCAVAFSSSNRSMWSFSPMTNQLGLSRQAALVIFSSLDPWAKGPWVAWSRAVSSDAS
jgi:hypothetical protein